MRWRTYKRHTGPEATSQAGRGQRGQVVALTAVLLVVVLGAAALAVDVGVLTHTRTSLQAKADAMALAGSLELCNTSTCMAAAQAEAASYGTKNGVKPTDNVQISLNTTCSGQSATPGTIVTVRITRDTPTTFARVLGITGADITACATAGRYALGGTNGVRPFALDDDCIRNVGYGGTVILKYDASSVGGTCSANQGNFSAVRIDGSGASIYEATIKFGSNTYLCAQGTEGCTHYTLMTETGNMISANRDGINYLINNTPSSCSTWDQVSTSTGDIKPACNPWLPGYTGTTSRIVVVPVVVGLYSSGGTSPVPIKKFALVFIEGFNGNCTGNSCEVKARFIKSTLTIPNAKKAAVAPDTDIAIASLTH